MRRRGMVSTGHKFNFQSFFEPIVNMAKGLKKKFLKRSLEVTSGLEADFVNPDSMLDAKGKDVRFYDTMMLDSEIKGAVELKKTLVLSTDWKILAGSEEDIDLEIQKFVKEEVLDKLEIPFDDALDNTLDAMVYGYKVGEIIWNDKPVDGKVTWRKFKFMHSYLFDFKYNEFDDLESVAIGRTVGSKLEVKADEFNKKFVCMVWPYIKDGNYYGDSDLRELFVEYWQRFNIIRWRGVYLQGFAFRVPIITYDVAKTSKEELSALDDMFDNWQDLMRVKIPGQRDPITKELNGKFEIDWREVGSKNGADQFTAVLVELAKDVRRKLLFPDKLGFTTDKGGALSQSEIFWKLFLKVIKRIQRRLEDIYNAKIRMLVDLNFPGVEKYPLFKFNDIDHDIEVAMLKLLLDGGVIDKREKWIRSKVDVPQLDAREQEEINKAKEQDVKDQQELFAQNQKDNGGDEDGNRNGSNDNSNRSGDNLPNGGKFNAGKKGVDGDEKKQFKVARPTNFDKIKTQLDTNENDFIRDYTDIHKTQSDRLIKTVQTKDIVENKDLKAVNKLRIQTGELKRLFSIYYSKLYFEGKRDAAQEIRAQSKELKINFKADGKYEFQLQDDLHWLSRDWIDGFLESQGELGTLTALDTKYLTDLRATAFRITGETSERILKSARGAIDQGIRGNLTTAGVVGKLENILSEDRKRFALTIARTNASDAYNTGRMNEFLSPKIAPLVEAFQYNAIIDKSTTEFCASHDGQVISKSDPELANIVPPNHFNCRSLLVAILVGQDEISGGQFQNFEENLPAWGTSKNIDGTTFDTDKVSVRKPAKGFGG